jgi:hypothetical protein
MVNSHPDVEVEVRVHPRITSTLVSGLSALIVVTCAAPFDVAVTFHPASRRERTNVL